MITQDETILHQSQDNAQAAAAAMPAEETTDKKTTARWQTATIGGVAGIAMGMAASQAYATLSTDTADVELVEDGDGTTAETEGATVTEVHQATVDQNLSFGEAFTAARAEVGAGGVFIWHGQLYNTYTAEEWQAMSDAQKDEFATDVQPYLGQQTAAVHHTTTAHTAEPSQPDSNIHQTSHTEEVTTEPEVHFLGVDTREVEGQTVNIGHMSIDDVQVALVDVDNDQVFDVSVVDVNNNGQLDEGDNFTDISTQGLHVSDFQILSEAELSQTDHSQFEQASNMQEDLAPDMPDYMNDADVDLV